MDLTILEKYQGHFPSCSDIIAEFPQLYHKKLWNELSIKIMEFIYHKKARGRLTFEFYTRFVAHIRQHINKITHLKVLKECLVSVENKEALEFLKELRSKEAISEEQKIIILGLESLYIIETDKDECIDRKKQIQEYISKHKNVDSFMYSVFYRFTMGYYLSKGKLKLFYEEALKFLAYTSPVQLNQKDKTEIIVNMGITCLCSSEIYNFSELLQQPLLLSLSQSPYKWLYDLLQIFRRGDVVTYDSVIDNAVTHHKQLKKKRRELDKKIRLMSFIELAFNLPKGNKIISFNALEKKCAVPEEHIQFLVMKAAAYNLVKVEINQIDKIVEIKWVAPKVLENEHLTVIGKKLSQWQQKLNESCNFVEEYRKSLKVK